MSLMPDLEGLLEKLSPWSGKSAYIIPMTDSSGRPLGNNGDFLMLAIFNKILTAASIKPTMVREEADLVIVPPSGGLLEIYSFPELLAERLRGFEGVPLVIFPSSAWFQLKDPSFIFARRSAETLWILREQKSFDHLKQLWATNLSSMGVNLALDHDVVAAGHKYVPEILGNPTSGRPLVGARLDAEGRTVSDVNASKEARQQKSNLIHTASKMIPYGSTFTALARTVRHKKIRHAGEDLLLSIGMSEKDFANAYFMDVSAVQFATFDEYARSIASASRVITNRLHIGLPAIAYGKEVILVEAGYHKLQGVFEQSLKDLDNVTLKLLR